MNVHVDLDVDEDQYVYVDVTGDQDVNVDVDVNSVMSVMWGCSVDVVAAVYVQVSVVSRPEFGQPICLRNL